MKRSNSGQRPRKKGELVMAWGYLALFLFFATIAVLRALSLLPGEPPDWCFGALILVGLAAVLSGFLSLPQFVNRILWIILTIIFILKVIETVSASPLQA